MVGLLVTIVLKYMGRLVLSLFNPSSCLPGRLEPGVLRPYRHVLQRGGRRTPTHHTVTSCLHFITAVGRLIEAGFSVNHRIPSQANEDGFSLKAVPLYGGTITTLDG